MIQIKNNNNGVGVVGLLGVVFVALKLLNVINWSWFYVTMPFWLPLIILILLFLVMVLLIG